MAHSDYLTPLTPETLYCWCLCYCAAVRNVGRQTNTKHTKEHSPHRNALICMKHKYTCGTNWLSNTTASAYSGNHLTGRSAFIPKLSFRQAAARRPVSTACLGLGQKANQTRGGDANMPHNAQRTKPNTYVKFNLRNNAPIGHGQQEHLWCVYVCGFFLCVHD